MSSIVSIQLLLFIPLLSSILLFSPIFKNNQVYLRRFSEIVSMIILLYSGVFYFGYEKLISPECKSCILNTHFITNIPILDNQILNQLGIKIQFGVSSLSVIMILLTTFIIMLSIFSAKRFIKEKHNYFYALVFLLEFILIGIFSSNDMFLFFLLWELELIPMYFLISIWGNKHAQKSALKFVLYTFGGSLFLLSGILLLYFWNYNFSGIFSANLSDISVHKMNFILQIIINILFLIGFGVKIPIIPLHKWLIETHSNASTPISVILAGILLKLGVYGLIRFNLTLLPLGFTHIISILGGIAIINIIYGAALAYKQNNIKRIIAASSISQMGISLLGLSAMNPIGINGAIYQLISHGIISGGLFIIIGIIKSIFKTENIINLSGIASCINNLFNFTIIISFAAIGVPFFSGFIGEFLSIYGAINSPFLIFEFYSISAIIVLMLSALYILKILHEVFYGQPLDTCKINQKLTINESFILYLISTVVILLGCFPNIIISFLNI